ncbi:hypothetical protein FBU59_000596 [Linderina macrospora]|uniref:Uncharacterized protein n=1 Tax=Linderina macrospora TaxID=4868 RepID=A0ACC1JGI7_9FUNG|nr:hypothetical protein FBU59_000596 [Linderina macrospora]
MYNATSRGWTVNRDDIESAWVSPSSYIHNGAFVVLPDLTKHYPQNMSSTFMSDHVVLTNMSYFDVQSRYPIAGRTNNGTYNALNIFATTQYNLGPKGLVDYFSDNSRITQGIYAIQLDLDMILYYHVRVNSTHHAYNSTYCKDTPYGSVFLEHHANIADAGVPFSELSSDKLRNYTGHVADISFDHTDSSFKVTLTSISQHNAQLGYMASNMCDTYFYQSEIRYKIVQTNSTSTATVAPAEFGTSIITMDENGYSIAGMSFCSSIALFNDPYASCDWSSFTKSIQNYHPLVKSVMNYKSDQPSREISILGDKYRIKEGIYIGIAGKVIFVVIVSLAIAIAFIQRFAPGLSPYSSHAMDIVAVASFEEPGKFNRLPCMAFQYEGNHLDGYRIRLNGHQTGYHYP